MTRRSKRNLTHTEARDLDIEIGFLAGLTRRDPAYVEALQLLGDAYSRRGRFNDSLKVDQQVVRLRPEDPRALYNLACSLALNNNPEGAYDALNRAVDAGYRDFHWLARDPDLAAFRKHPLYRRLRARLKALRDAMA